MESRLTDLLRALQERARVVWTTLSSMGGDGHTRLLVLAVGIGAAAGAAMLVFYAAIDVIQGLVLRSARRLAAPAALLIRASVAVDAHQRPCLWHRPAAASGVGVHRMVRRGVVLTHGADAAVLARLPVHESMHRRPLAIPESANLHQIVGLTRGTRQTEFPVVGNDGRLVGMLAQAAVREALEDGDQLRDIVLAMDLAVPERDPLTSEDTLLTALRRLGGREVNLLPVVRPDDRERFEGTVSRQDLMAAYERALTVEGR